MAPSDNPPVGEGGGSFAGTLKTFAPTALLGPWNLHGWLAQLGGGRGGVAHLRIHAPTLSGNNKPGSCVTEAMQGHGALGQVESTGLLEDLGERIE